MKPATVFVIGIALLLSINGCKRVLLGIKQAKEVKVQDVANFYKQKGISRDDVYLQTADIYEIYHLGDTIFDLNDQLIEVCQKNCKARAPFLAARFLVYDSLGRWVNQFSQTVCLAGQESTFEAYLKGMELNLDTSQTKLGTLEKLLSNFRPLGNQERSFSNKFGFVVIFDASFLPRYTRKQLKYFSNFEEVRTKKIDIIHCNLDFNPGIEDALRARCSD